MPRIKILAFIAIGALVHFGLLLAVIFSRLDCGIQPRCVSRINMLAGDILAFPVNLFSRALYSHGVGLGGWYFILMFVNSILAVTLIWFVFIRLLIGRNKVT